MGSRRQGFSILDIIAAAILSVFAGLLALSYLSMYVNPASAWYFSIFGLLFIPLCLLNIFLLIWALCRKSRTFIIPLIALLPGIMMTGRYVRTGSAPEPSGEGECVKIMTYNIGKSALSAEHGSPDHILDSIAGLVRQNNPDVVCFQEFRPGKRNITELLNKLFPGYNPCYYINVDNDGSSGNITLTKFPIEGKGHFDFAESANLAIFTDIRFKNRVIRVYNCHFQSYSISLASLAHSWKQNDVVKETEHKIKKSIKKRPLQVNQIMEDIENCPVDAIVLGDFNDTPMSYTYHRLRKDRKDSFAEAGKGFGATYSLLWPLIRIDYILFPSDCDGVSYSCPHWKLSDHYPVFSEICIPVPEKAAD